MSSPLLLVILRACESFDRIELHPHLTLRSERSERLEGWQPASCPLPPFETLRFATLLRVRWGCGRITRPTWPKGSQTLSAAKDLAERSDTGRGAGERS